MTCVEVMSERHGSRTIAMRLSVEEKWQDWVAPGEELACYVCDIFNGELGEELVRIPAAPLSSSDRVSRPVTVAWHLKNGAVLFMCDVCCGTWRLAHRRKPESAGNWACRRLEGV